MKREGDCPHRGLSPFPIADGTQPAPNGGARDRVPASSGHEREQQAWFMTTGKSYLCANHPRKRSKANSGAAPAQRRGEWLAGEPPWLASEPPLGQEASRTVSSQLRAVMQGSANPVRSLRTVLEHRQNPSGAFGRSLSIVKTRPEASDGSGTTSNDHPKPPNGSGTTPNDHPKPPDGSGATPNDHPKPPDAFGATPNDHPKPPDDDLATPNDRPKPPDGHRVM